MNALAKEESAAFDRMGCRASGMSREPGPGGVDEEVFRVEVAQEEVAASDIEEGLETEEEADDFFVVSGGRDFAPDFTSDLAATGNSFVANCG